MKYRNKINGLIVTLVSSNLSTATIEAPSTDHRLKCHTLSTVSFHKAYVKVS